MQSMSSITKQHNVEICRIQRKTQPLLQKQRMVPLEGYCFKECMIYEAKVITGNNFKLYQGTCEGECNSCFYKHMKSFRDRGNETELSKYIWQLMGESKNLQHTLRNIYVCNALKMWHKALRSMHEQTRTIY